ncbi:hypothetical protein LEP1GSC158_3723 [Leptospira interrogans serovar Zanoni str. LT2156]|uniref:Uncharacterized protein n=1 Tax=Leptospira interrogans serovar Zanoni str. LT2156 TaxID=1001601 RepID=M6HHS9_LEPIR|nr:hypothetical protein LEP1GSC158_3723 [Leptospira interrogans serovar Zanoni str. LT2156]
MIKSTVLNFIEINNQFRIYYQSLEKDPHKKLIQGVAANAARALCFGQVISNTLKYIILL